MNDAYSLLYYEKRISFYFYDKDTQYLYNKCFKTSF